MKRTPNYSTSCPHCHQPQPIDAPSSHTWSDAAARWSRETLHKADHAKDQSKLRWLHRHWGHLRLDEITRAAIDNIPIARLRLMLTPFNVTADCKFSFATNDGTIACHAETIPQPTTPSRLA